MRSQAQRILDQALQLSAEERVDLIEALGDSLDGDLAEVDENERAEISDRIDAAERGDMKIIPGDEVAARLAQALDDVTKR
jgi:putative addiction module component (TIGR02574 family)